MFAHTLAHYKIMHNYTNTKLQWRLKIVAEMVCGKLLLLLNETITCVTYVKQCGYELGNFQLREEIEYGIHENIYGRTSRNYKALPPPVVILK